MIQVQTNLVVSKWKGAMIFIVESLDM